MAAADKHSLGILLINQSWFADELRQLGHTVITSGWVHDAFDIRFERLTELNDLLSRLPENFQLDRIIYFDDSHSASLRGLEGLPVPSMFYSIDAHHHWQWHAWFTMLFDLVLVAQRDYVSLFRLDNPAIDEDRLLWMPLWTPFYESSEEKDIDVSFRGTLDPDLHPERAEFFRELSEFVPVDASAGAFPEVYGRSKIVVNQNVGNDVNFRVFEALMCGACLVTPGVENGLKELFTDGKEIVTYPRGDARAAGEIILELLKDDKRRKAIAAAGRDVVLKNHSAMARAEDIEEKLLMLPFKNKPRRYFAAAFTALHGLGTFRPAFAPTTDEARAYRDKLVEDTRRNLLRSVLENEPIDEEFRAMVLICKCYLELLLTREELSEFSAEMCRACPGDLMLTLSYVEDLIALGQVEEATRLTGEISHSPQELMAALPLVLGSVRDRFFAPIRPKAE